jgi:hypothetical protein
MHVQYLVSRAQEPTQRNQLDRYDNPIPTRFLAPIDCLKIPALKGPPLK